MTGLSNEFETVQEFQHDSGLVEGIGYRVSGQLARYTAGGVFGPVIECEDISVLEAVRWWANRHEEGELVTSSYLDVARARFLTSVADAMESPIPLARVCGDS